MTTIGLKILKNTNQACFLELDLDQGTAAVVLVQRKKDDLKVCHGESRKALVQ